MFGLWRTFTDVVFYLTPAVGLAGLVGNGLVLWHLGFHIRKGPFSVYALHLATADFLFLCCHVGVFISRVALGPQDTVHSVAASIGFAVGLWLLAAFSLELCLSEVGPTCYESCRPRHTSGATCVLIWALSLPAVLLPAHACGQLRASARPLACLRYHAACIMWLLALVCVACVAGLVLFIWVACCSQRPRPKFYGAVLGSLLLLVICGLPYVLYWSLRPLLNFLLPMFPPLATLLACVHASSKPLIYLTAGRQPGKREPVRAVLQRALGDEAQQGTGELALPTDAL